MEQSIYILVGIILTSSITKAYFFRRLIKRVNMLDTSFLNNIISIKNVVGLDNQETRNAVIVSLKLIEKALRENKELTDNIVLLMQKNYSSNVMIGSDISKITNEIKVTASDIIGKVHYLHTEIKTTKLDENIRRVIQLLQTNIERTIELEKHIGIIK